MQQGEAGEGVEEEVRVGEEGILTNEDLLAIDEVRISRCTSLTWHALTDNNATHLHDIGAPSCTGSGEGNGAGAPPHGERHHARATCATNTYHPRIASIYHMCIPRLPQLPKMLAKHLAPLRAGMVGAGTRHSTLHTCTRMHHTCELQTLAASPELLPRK